MEMKQKKFSTKHTFTFEPEYANFAYKDKSGSGDFEFNYAHFPDKCSVVISHTDIEQSGNIQPN